jgi:hypothetical protein
MIIDVENHDLLLPMHLKASKLRPLISVTSWLLKCEELTYEKDE